MAEIRMHPGNDVDERTVFAPYSAFDIPADLRELHGRYDVEAIARRVRNFRYAEEWTMMLLGGWIATIPELPVKTGLGKIIWETAQAADKLGHRLPELRCGTRSATFSESPNRAFAEFIQALAEPETPDQTIEKLVGVFEVLKPHQLTVYEETSRETDQICDAPTIKILNEITCYLREHVNWGKEVLTHLCGTNTTLIERRRARYEQVQDHLRTCGGMVGWLNEKECRAHKPRETLMGGQEES